MKGKVRKSIKVSTITADIMYLDPNDNNHKIATLDPLTVNGKITPKNALVLIRTNYALPETATILIKSITQTAAIYEMDIDKFLIAAALAPKTDKPQTEKTK